MLSSTEMLSLYLARHRPITEGDVLFLKRGNNISDGAGLLMRKNSPFKNIAVLGWIFCLPSHSLELTVEQ